MFLDETTITVSVPADIDVSLITGVDDAVLREIESYFEADIVVRGDKIVVEGSSYETQAVTSLLADLFHIVRSGQVPTVADVASSMRLMRESAYAPSALRDDVLLTHRGRAIRPKTAGQKRYVDAIRSNVITFGLGPAGTGKTYLAMALAVSALKRKEVARIVLTRPVVEAGENLGFLPGTLKEKIDPYIRPLYDALFDMTDPQASKVLLDNGTIEIAPLAFMRGRTLNDAFVILDEAQNTTPEQMKMFLTRLGFGSRFVVTGDMSQSDLSSTKSALAIAREVLQGIDDIAFIELGSADVVRHNLVAKIVAAYDRAGKQKALERAQAKVQDQKAR